MPDITGGSDRVARSRIVYLSFPAHGHINPTLPVVRELARRGIQVAYYSTGSFRAAIEETGAQFFAYGPDFQMPEHGPGPGAQVSSTLEFLLRRTCAVLDHHLEEVRSLDPECIMFDSFAAWGGLVARLFELPTIASVPSILVNSAIVSRYERQRAPADCDPRLTAAWYRAFETHCHAALQLRGVAAPPSPAELLQTYGELNLIYTSREFQPLAGTFDGARFRFVGPCFDFRPQAPEFPFASLDGRPVVLVSLGTVYTERPRFLQKCVEELTSSEWQVVLATGAAELDGPFPRNFIVRAFVPQIEILRRASAFLTHGGMNSVQEALYHGVPLIVAPQGADQFWIAERTRELGAAIVLPRDSQPPGVIRASVTEVLSARAYSAAAARVGETLRLSGGASRAADCIEDFLDSQAIHSASTSPG